MRRLIARRLGVPVRQVSIVRGESSRDKLIEVEGIGDDELRLALSV